MEERNIEAIAVTGEKNTKVSWKLVADTNITSFWQLQRPYSRRRSIFGTISCENAAATCIQR